METKALTLYELEADLTALLDTEEMVEDPQARLQILQEIADKSEQAVTKRDNLIRFIQHAKAQIGFAKAEEDRLATWRKGLDSKLSEIEDYVCSVIEEHGTQPKRGTKRLDGTIGVLSIAKKPDTVDVEQPEQIPYEYLDVTLKTTGPEFEEMLLAVKIATGAETDLGTSLRKAANFSPRKREIMAAINAHAARVAEKLKAGEDLTPEDTAPAVAGADIRIGGNRLVVK